MSSGTQIAQGTEYTDNLKWVTDCLSVLAERGHERMTVRQALFFAATAYHRQMGETVTVPSLRAQHPLGRSIEKSKAQLSEPSGDLPDALGWLQQETDPADGRRRYLSLTKAGAEALDVMPLPPKRLSIARIRERLREARGAGKDTIEP